MADSREAAGHGRLSVVRTDTDGVTVVVLKGEVDHHSVKALTHVLPPARAVSAPRIVLDLTGVTFMDSSGVNALIAVHRATEEARGWLRLVGVRGAALRTVQLVGLDLLIPCHPDLREALGQ
ncbi:STAS domain-containing protein [Streptomyces sp. NPDC090106]|uniref:STAS domain-containing protein n=1 Tax=Streptomyces sp. NPDC090106 TaxID=3365946 RepID=UPI0037FA6967